MDYQHRITVESGKRSGKPCVRGLRITVSDVLEYMASGMTEDEILGEFPELERDDIKACLAFAADRERKLMWRYCSASHTQMWPCLRWWAYPCLLPDWSPRGCPR